MFVALCVYACLLVNLPIPIVHACTCTFVCLCVCMVVRVYVCMSICLYACVFVCLFVCKSVSPSGLLHHWLHLSV